MKLQHLNKKRLILIDLDGITLMDDGISIHSKTIEILKRQLMMNTIFVLLLSARTGLVSDFTEN